MLVYIDGRLTIVRCGFFSRVARRYEDARLRLPAATYFRMKSVFSDRS